MPQNAFTELLSTIAANNGYNDTIWSAFSYETYPGAYDWANDNITWMIPGVSRPRGNGQEMKSQLLDLSDWACSGHDVTPLPPTIAPTPQNILILTRGFCGSTCALFVGHAHFFHNVKTITLGGLVTQKQQQFYSFPGLQVVDSPDFYAMWAELQQNITYTPTPNPTELCPRLLKTSAGYRYCIREIYPPTSVDFSVPLEYIFTPSDFHMYFDAVSVLHSFFAWVKAVQYFPSRTY
jgi:hypothetical protein